MLTNFALNFDNPGLAPNFSKCFSHLTFVQSFYFQVGSIASYANDDFEIKKVYYDVQKRKACAFMQNRSDPDIEVRIPTIRVVTTTSSKGDVMDFNSLLEPMDQAYALFSAIKRMVGLSRKKHSLTATLVPCTPLTKNSLASKLAISKRPLGIVLQTKRDINGATVHGILYLEEMGYDPMSRKRWRRCSYKDNEVH